MKTAKSALSRRHFLLVGGAVGTATSTGAILTRRDSTQAPGREKPARSAGYEPTEHVRNYYRTARI